VQNIFLCEDAMKKIFNMLEDLFAAVAFAEAGEYDCLGINEIQPRYCEAVRMHA
jgi:hypothetical protein